MLMANTHSICGIMQMRKEVEGQVIRFEEKSHSPS